MTTLAILIWPVLALILFAKLPVAQAFIWAVLLPYMFLPEAFEIDLPAVPPLDKTNIIAIGLLLGLLVQGPKISNWAKTEEVLETAKPSLKALLILCFAVMIIGLVATVFTNQERLFYGNQVLPAAKPRDILSVTIQKIFELVPFYCAAVYLASPRRQNQLLTAIVTGSLIYTMLMLVEIRLSPQLHNWIYGYYQHSFVQHIRDGFRPMVFLEHGLWVGFFTFSGAIAALGLWRGTGERKWLGAAVWILLVLALSNNLGALMIAVVLGGAFFVLPKRVLLWMVSIIAAFVFLFPAVRGTVLLPTDQLLNFSASVSEDRAQSLQYRFDNEDILLEKAARKPWFGWGGWSRNRVFDESGQDVSTTDGLWIIVLGQFGWVGYLASFGLLVLPLVYLRAAQKRKDIPFETVALAMIGAGNLIYIIPNATLTPIGMLMFGAVAGYAIYDTKTGVSDAVSKETGARRRGSAQFTRGKDLHVRKPAPRHTRQV